MKKILLLGLTLFLIQSIRAQVTRSVSSFSELLAALAASASNDTISLAADITATSSVAISKSVQIQGNAFTLSAIKPGVTALGTLENTTTIYALINITGSGSEVGIQDLVMVGGNYTGSGSALKVASGTKVNIKNSQITRSVGVNGGAIYNEGSLSMENVVIRRNYAVLGGGIYNKGGGARLFIDNVALIENRTLNLTGSGGAIYNVAGGSVYINNGTLSNNQSNVAGGAIYNGPNSIVYLVNVTATGNVVYNQGSTKGPVVANNGGKVEIINSVLAYNYKSEDYGDNYILDDLSPIAFPAGIKMYYSYYHGPLPLGIGGNVNNIAYGGNKKGTDNSLFSGGILSPVDSIGFEIGMDSIYRPYLFEEGGTVIAPLKFGSELLEAMNGGTSTRFGLSLGETCSGFNTSDFTKNGTAAVVNSNTVKLTDARRSQSGSVWANERVDLNEDFSLDAEIYLGTTDRFGADGIAFVFQPLSVNAGSSGGGLGYAGINPSLAIEYDTWRNSADPTSFDHSSIMLNGNTGRHNDVVPYSSIGNIEDGRWHSVKITWDATSKTLTHVFDGNQLFSTQYDIVANVFGGNPYVYWGFTAATGGAVNLQQVRFNEICSVSENYSPAIAYYDGYGYKNVTGSTQPNQQVTKDQSGGTRLEPPVRGAVEKIITNLVSLKVVNDPDESTPLGTYTGGSIYGEVFPAGTRKIVTAVPQNNTTAFQFWRYLLGGGNDSKFNPFDAVIERNTTIFPEFYDCGTCCEPVDGGLISEDQSIDAGTAPEMLVSTSLARLQGTTGSIKYQWQYATTFHTDSFKNVLVGGNDEFYSPGILTDTTWFRRMSRNDCGGGGNRTTLSGTEPEYPVSSNVIKITVNPIFQAPGGGQVACVDNVVIALGDNCEAIITSDAVTNPTFYNQFIYMDATDIPSSFPLNAITTQDSFYGEGTWMYGLYNNTPDDKGLHQLICWGTFRSQDIDVPTLIGDTIGVEDDPSTVIKENLFQQYGGLKEMNFLTWQGDLDYDDGAFQPGNWSCWQSTNHADDDFTWPDDEFRTFDTMRIRPSFSGYLSLIAASKLNTNESANEATFDPVVAVYADGFDPNNPCENLVSFGESAFIPNPLAGMGFFEGSPGTLSGAQQSLKKIFAPWLLHENPVVRMDIQVQAGKEYVVVVTHRNFEEKVFTREDMEWTTGF